MNHFINTRFLGHLRLYEAYLANGQPYSHKVGAFYMATTINSFKNILASNSLVERIVYQSN